MKKIIILILVTSNLFSVFGQDLGVRYESCLNCEVANDILTRPRYGTSRNMPTSFVTSDYGRRDNPGGTEWHKGIDLSAEGGDQDLGDHILAIESGTVRLLGGSNAYKYIAIDGVNNFGYAHIFRDLVPSGSDYYQLGDLFLKRMDLPHAQKFAIILYPYDLATPAAATAIADVNGTVTFQGHTINVRNNVNANEIIAPIGDAQGGNAHLHLHKFNNIPTFTNSRNNTKNPLEVVAHAEPDYSIEFDQNVIVQKYGTASSSIKVRVRMNNETDDDTGTYDHGVMNVDEVRLEMKPFFEWDYQLIKGAKYESRMDMGGRRYHTIYPPWTPSPTNDDMTDRDGSTTIFGVNPFAYSTTNAANAGEPYDDYYFSDFVTRILDTDAYGGTVHLATHNDKARYKDGLYDIRAQAITVTGTPATRYAAPLVIDNFRPYVKSVTIFRNDESGVVLYIGDYVTGSSNVNNIDLNEISANDALYVRVDFSEPMEINTVSVETIDIPGHVFERNTLDQKTFFFSLPFIGATKINDEQTLRISGQDLNGNSLQKNPAVVSIRTGANSWSPTPVPGNDTNYKFNNPPDPCGITGNIVNREAFFAVQSAISGECLYVGFEADKQNPLTFEPVVFTSTGSDDSSLTYNWNFGSGATPSTASGREVTVMYETNGPKTVKLEVCSGGTCASDEVTGFMNVGSPFEPLIVDFSVQTGDTYLEVNEEVTLNAVVSGAQGPLKYEWTLGEGVSPSTGFYDQQSATFSYTSEGTRSISLTVFDGLRNVTKTKNSYLNVNGYSPPIEVWQRPCPSIIGSEGAISLNGYSFVINDFSDGNANNEIFSWSMGDGTFYSTSRVDHSYTSPGTYRVTLTVCDESGCSENFCDVTVPVNVFAPKVLPNFTVNGQVSHFWTKDSNGNDIPNAYFLDDISAGLDLTLNDISYEENGRPINNQRFKIFRLNNGSEVFDLEGAGPHTVQLPWPNETYRIRYEAGSTWAIFNNIEADETSQVAENCSAEIINFSLNNECWNTASPPTFNVEIDGNTCDYDYIYILDINDGSRLITTSNNGFVWTARTPSSFPYTSDFLVKVLHDCGGGSNCATIAEKTMSFTLYGPPEIAMQKDYQVCTGGSIQIGLDSNPSYSYEWTKVGSSDINYLSDATSSNPTFVAYNDGTFRYDMKMTDNTYGCSSTERVTITTGAIQAESYATKVSAGDKTALESPAIGGGGLYNYQWSPETYLDNPRVASPIFNAPDFVTNISYTVDISFRGGCVPDVSPITVDVEVENLPPSNLQVDVVTSVFPILNWRNNGVVKEFRVQRSADGGSNWTRIGTVNGNTTSFQDIDCSLSYSNYKYRVRAIDVNGSHIGYSNTANTFVEGVAAQYLQVYSLDVTEQITLAPPVSRDPGLFSYDWGTDQYLSSQTAANPVFSAPNFGGWHNYLVNIDYQGICQTSGQVSIRVINYEANNLTVALNSQLFPQLSWDNTGILKEIVIERSFDGTSWDQLYTVSGDANSYLDTDCLEAGNNVCYRLKSYDVVNKYVDESNTACQYIPYNPGIVQTIEHTLPGNNGMAINKKSIFNGYGGSTVVSVENFNNSSFGAIDANSAFVNGQGESYYQYVFKNTSYENVKSSIVTNSNASIQYYPTSLAESPNYFFSVGYFERNDLPANSAFIFRYRKSDGSISSKRLYDWQGNPVELKHGPIVKTMGDNPIVALTDKVPRSNFMIMTPTNWTNNEWEYGGYYSHSAKELTLGDMFVWNNRIYILWKQVFPGNPSISESPVLGWYYIDGNGIIRDGDEYAPLSGHSSPANFVVHPMFVKMGNEIYSIAEQGSNSIYISKKNLDLSSTIWQKVASLPMTNYQIRSFITHNDELIAIGQSNGQIAYISFDKNGIIQRTKTFEVEDLDYVLDGDFIGEDLIVTYIRSSAQATGEVASILFTSQPETLGANFSLCESDLTGSDSFVGYQIHLGNDCNIQVDNGESLDVMATKKIKFTEGFKAKPGSTFHASIIGFDEVDCSNGSSGGRVVLFESDPDPKIIEETALGEDIELSTYPNPTHDYLKIKFNTNESEFVNMSLINLNGLIIYEKLHGQMPILEDDLFIGDLTKGIYILKVDSQFGSFERKIIIK